jgi:hypothetical protein
MSQPKLLYWCAVSKNLTEEEPTLNRFGFCIPDPDFERYRYTELILEFPVVGKDPVIETIVLQDDGYRIYFRLIASSASPTKVRDYGADWILWADYKQCDLPGYGSVISDFLMRREQLQQKDDRPKNPDNITLQKSHTKFWVVCSTTDPIESRHRDYVKHYSYAEAVTEAQRLAETNLSKEFVIMESGMGFVAHATISTFTTNGSTIRDEK